jgi:transcriptional regulator with AAA-type ATPase domain
MIKKIPYIVLIFMLLFLENLNAKYSGEKDSLYAGIKSIVISKNDVSNLNGWPIERRWYSLLIRKIMQGGAKRIFFDIAFPSADILHPESDELFYSRLNESPNIYLLTEKKNDQNTQPVILGSKTFDIRKTFYPFSEGYSIGNNHLIFQKGKGALTDFFLPQGLSNEFSIIDFPDSEIKPDYNLSEVLLENCSFSGCDVIVYVDYPGISSYIVTSDKNTSTTGSLQIWAIHQIIAGNYKLYWSHWIFILLVLVIWLPLVLCFFFKQNRIRMILLSLGIWVCSYLIIHFSKIYIYDWWYFSVFPVPAVFVIFYKRTAKREETNGQINVQPESQIANEQVRELQYKLDYYEKLSSQVPVDNLEGGYESCGICCHASSPMVDILRKAEQVAKNDIQVIIYGESGTGKEKLAQFIHQNSDRKDKPFIAVNCGALNENLIESELFGYEKGSFTGAYQQKPGRFELADGGILFLDEISETSLSFQVKLLRVLQEKMFERVGGTKSIKVSVRIIAATHQNMKSLIQKGIFREDLFYRLNGYEFSIPALRERTEDIEYLFKYFLYDINPQIKYSEPLIDWLKEQAWPGNIRQLKSSIQRAVINAQVFKRAFLITKDFELDATKKDIYDDNNRISDKILQRFRDHEFSHRSVSAVANDLMIHRSTVTEYLRGWVIRFLNSGNSEIDYVLSSIRGTAPVNDENQFRNRMNEYIGYAKSKIDEGISLSYSDIEIQSRLFKNLPGEFREDLIQLIQKTRSMEMN